MFDIVVVALMGLWAAQKVSDWICKPLMLPGHLCQLVCFEPAVIPQLRFMRMSSVLWSKWIIDSPSFPCFYAWLSPASLMFGVSSAGGCFGHITPSKMLLLNVIWTGMFLSCSERDEDSKTLLSFHLLTWLINITSAHVQIGNVSLCLSSLFLFTLSHVFPTTLLPHLHSSSSSSSTPCHLSVSNHLL